MSGAVHNPSPDASSPTAPGEDGQTAESRQSALSWSEREDLRRRRVRSRTLCAGILILGTLGLLLCPVLFFTMMRTAGEHPDTYPNTPDRGVAAACTTAAGALLIGWLLLEGGLALAWPRLIVQILARIPMYLYIVLMSLLLAATLLLSTIPMGP